MKLDDCLNTPSKPLYALILAPTRELVAQIKQHLTQAVKYTDIKVSRILVDLQLYIVNNNIDNNIDVTLLQIATVFGGLAAVKQERILNKGPEIVIATPGRLWELIQQGNSHLSQVDSIR